jgi:hypothetical protein
MSRESKTNQESISRRLHEWWREVSERVFRRENYEVDPSRAREYLQIDRSRELMSGESRDVPVGEKSTVRFERTYRSAGTDRPIAQYQEMVFPDEYVRDDHATIMDKHDNKYGENWNWRYLLEPGEKKVDQSGILRGGEAEAFAPGKVVIDLGSGEALADIQLSQIYPEACIVGVDAGYDQIEKPDIGKPGLQLVKDDWSTLTSIPDNSVDTILSVQGAFTWGFGSNEEAIPLVQTITRVAKDGAVLRFDRGFSVAPNTATEDGVYDLLRKHGWDIEIVDFSVIAKLTNNMQADN